MRKVINEFKDKMDSLMNDIKNERIKRHQIEGHPLNKAEPLIKNLYLVNICAIMMCGKDSVNDAQVTFMSRLIEGARAEYTAEDYLRMTLEINSEKLSEVLAVLKIDPTLKYAFVLDALIFSHLQECSDEQMAYIADLFDVLGITEQELNYLASFAKAILTKDEKLFAKAIALRPVHMSKQAFIYYAKLLSEDIAKSMAATTREELDDIMKGRKGDSHVLYMTLEDFDGFGYTFEHGDEITFRNCHFSCFSPIRFGNFSKVSFEDCSFLNFNTSTIELDYIVEASFLRCEFTDCIVQRFLTWTTFDCVIKCKDSKTLIDISHCYFTNCGGGGSSYRSIISNGQVRICSDSVFQNCRLSLDNNASSSEGALFDHVIRHENNRLIASAKLYED